MEYIGLICVLMVLTTVPSVTYTGNSRHFVTENCGHVVGPDYGAYLEFDRAATFKKGVVGVPDALKGQEFECIIVVRGMPTTGEKRFMALHMRQFHLKEQAVVRPENEVAKCGKAYVIIYNGMDRNAAEKFVFCGADAVTQNLEWTGEYMTFYFYIDYRNPDLSTVDPLVSLPPATGNTTLSPPTTTPDPFPYPTVYFKMDITSYDFECNETIDKVSLKCNDSKRCIDDSLKCDFGSLEIVRQMFTHVTTPTTINYEPNRAAAWKAARLQRGSLISQDMSEFSQLGYPDSLHGEHSIRHAPGGYPSQNGSLRPKKDGLKLDISNPFTPYQPPRKKNIISQICPCMSSTTAVEGGPRKSIKSGQVAPFPNGRGSIPNGVPTTPGSFEQRLAQPFDFYPRNNAKNVSNAPPNPQVETDSVNLANNWMRLLSADGSHLREQR
ncbi:unnamed protein product [Mytilus edulis]|uniref:CUB domain-containing protein n=1 Tax=Mytilus edulis TaxID=6550 RepID=A0A8S3TLY1_MYTED|nr:unnamed protein product [Mytilus edulis]